jgi:hypothetical protein
MLNPDNGVAGASTHSLNQISTDPPFPDEPRQRWRDCVKSPHFQKDNGESSNGGKPWQGHRKEKGNTQQYRQQWCAVFAQCSIEFIDTDIMTVTKFMNLSKTCGKQKDSFESPDRSSRFTVARSMPLKIPRCSNAVKQAIVWVTLVTRAR